MNNNEIIKVGKTMQVIKMGNKYFVQSLINGKIEGGWTVKHTAESYMRIKEIKRV